MSSLLKTKHRQQLCNYYGILILKQFVLTVYVPLLTEQQQSDSDTGGATWKHSD